MTNDCQYQQPGEPELHCWQDYEDGTKRKGPRECARRYHWVEENEDLAYEWMPRLTIRWLLIAESPPCPRDEDEPPYIYRIITEREKRPILEAIVSAYKIATSDNTVLRDKTDKLRFMKKNGAFLMDLSDYPLNRLEKAIRKKERIESEYGLYLRLLKLLDGYDCNIENIVIMGKGWHANVLGAVVTAGLGHLVRNTTIEIPFPDRFHYAECRDLLSRFFEDPEYEKKHVPVRGEES